jgi:hypothetical protein
LTISMTNPTSGATVSGLITLSAKTSGGTAIREVRFYVDGNMVSSIDLVAPYAVSWDTTWVSNGAHIVSANAFDINGKNSSAEPLVVTVQNVPLTNTYSIPDAGGQVVELTSIPSIGPLTIRTVTVEPAAGQSVPAGLAVFAGRYQYGEGEATFAEAGFAASTPVTNGRIFADIDVRRNTGLAFANPGSDAATVAFYFTNSEGLNTGNGSFTLGAGRQMAAYLTEAPFNAKGPLLGTLTFASTAPVAVLGLDNLFNGTDPLFSTLPVAPIGSGSSDPLSMPLYVAGDGWTTEVILTNPSDSPISGIVKFLSPDGSPASLTINGATSTGFSYLIQPRAATRLVADGTSTTQTGSVKVVPIGNYQTPSATAIFYYTTRGITVSYASVPAAILSPEFLAYVEDFGTPGAIGSIRSGVAISNVSDLPVTVQLQLTDLNGSPAGSTILTLPANGQASKFVDELFPSLAVNFRGTIRALGTIAGAASGLGVTGIRIRYNERGDFLFSSTPPTDVSTPRSNSPVVFAHVLQGAGYTTQLILFSDGPGAKTGKMIYRNRDGTVILGSSPAQ